jgi:hypothetical protein
VASVNGISPVDVGADQIPFGLVLAKNIFLVRTCVGSKHCIPINVICVCPTPPGVVRGESQRIEVLSDGHNGREVVVCGKSGRRQKRLRPLETRLDDLTGQAQRMGWLNMETAIDRREN